MRYDFTNRTSELARGNKRLYLLGQSTDGPVFEPMHITYPNRAKELFGEGNLIEAYEEASLVKDIDIYLVRISGTQSRGSLLEHENLPGEEIPQTLLEIRSVFAGDKYNGITARVEGGKFVVYSAQGQTLRDYSLEKLTTMRDLVDAINEDRSAQKSADKDEVARKKIFARTETPDREVKDCLPENMDLLVTESGSDGTQISKNELYLALEETYAVLEGQKIDVICPYPVRFDDAHPQFVYGDGEYGAASYSSGDFLTLVEEGDAQLYATFYEQLIDFCKGQEASGEQTHGVIGIREIQDLDSMRYQYLNRLTRANGLKERYGLVDFEGNMIDKGYYISVFAQEFLHQAKRFNGCATYAAMITKTHVKETLTMKQFPKELELAYELSPTEILDLSFLGVVTARTSVKYGAVVSNSVTAGLSGTPLHQLINIRTAQGALRVINSLLDDLVGSTIIYGVTEREVERRLLEGFRYLYEEEILKDYSYQVAYSNGGENIEISIEMTPRNATEAIQVSTGINVSGGLE